MIRIYQKGKDYVAKTTTLKTVEDVSGLIWVDLQNSTIDEIEEVEKQFSINIPTKLQQEEIESSSRYFELDEYTIVNSSFLQSDDESNFQKVHVSFLIKNEVLVTYREGNLRSFAECVKKIKANHKNFINGKIILIVLFETRVDFDADLIEALSRKISMIGKLLTNDDGTHAGIIKEITTLQEITMQLRENIIDKQRVISSMLKSGDFIEEEKERLRIIFRDINSLIEHTNFQFERLEYLQNTFLGLVNIDQNKIIKIFTVVSVVFMPPTLIASIYGMNFKALPELDWKIGYPFALILMFASSFITLMIFKKRKWL
jgi:magnesium transporter